jgi:hypothetical protein
VTQQTKYTYLRQLKFLLYRVVLANLEYRKVKLVTIDLYAVDIICFIAKVWLCLRSYLFSYFRSKVMR